MEPQLHVTPTRDFLITRIIALRDSQFDVVFIP